MPDNKIVSFDWLAWNLEIARIWVLPDFHLFDVHFANWNQNGRFCSYPINLSALPDLLPDNKFIDSDWQALKIEVAWILVLPNIQSSKSKQNKSKSENQNWFRTCQNLWRIFLRNKNEWINVLRRLINKKIIQEEFSFSLWEKCCYKFGQKAKKNVQNFSFRLCQFSYLF